jgi:serine/threonine-protein kinase
MGEVYRARDTRLKRDIAIKVLPEGFSQDPDRLARFQREAELLASLNHPHIAAIYGREQANGVQALVLELVEGPTLGDRIARGPIALDEARPIARQIAEALEAAHEQGIVHRDLKPANIKLRKDGAVKILDFGLAKALPDQPTMVSDSATVMGGTLPGLILGTAPYMSPEQATGKEADRATDIWAFGCVLYEMLTGRPAFEGQTVGDIIAGILRSQPDWSLLPAGLPANIRRLLRHCLEKDRRDRLKHIGDAGLEMRHVELPGRESVGPPRIAGCASGPGRSVFRSAH